MRPGEITPADAPAPAAEARRVDVIVVHNSGRFSAYLTSHVRLERASPTLRFDRDRATGARPRLPAGASVQISPGATLEMEIIWD